MIDWKKITKQDTEIIRKIVKRAGKVCNIIGLLSLEMDLTATHLGCPLKLSELLKAPKFDFAHDIGGIEMHLNRTTGKLENCFLPRYAK